jgi:hypothetical protein
MTDDEIYRVRSAHLTLALELSTLLDLSLAERAQLRAILLRAEDAALGRSTPNRTTATRTTPTLVPGGNGRDWHPRDTRKR